MDIYKMNDLSIILPSYQEADNLKDILPFINEELCKEQLSYEIIVVDTEIEMDDTYFVCKNNNCKYVKREGGNSYGDALRTGIKESCGEYIIIMDADGSHDIRDIVNLYNTIKEKKCDLVIASRYCNGGQTKNNILSISMSRILNITYKIAFHINAEDLSNSFRIYKSSQIKKIILECDNFDVVEEILIKLYYSFENFLIKEVPTTFYKRNKGQSKRHLVSFIFSYLVTMKKLLYIKGKIQKLL